MSASLPADNRRLALKLAAVALAMAGFGYLLVPLYRVVCELTGFNGGVVNRVAYGEAARSRVDTARWVTVEFVATTHSGISWEFRPAAARLQVHPGELVLTRFHAQNPGPVALIGQAVPSITPGRAAAYFQKIECFCFSRQLLAPGEQKELPVQFQIDPDLPADIGTLTLSYTFFAAPGMPEDAPVIATDPT